VIYLSHSPKIDITSLDKSSFILYTIDTIKKERKMWKIVNTKTNEVVKIESCPGNAAELAMVLDEIKELPSFTHKVVKIEDA